MTIGKLLLKHSEYLFVIAGLDEVLNSLKLSPELQNFILNQPNELKQHYIAAIKKNPNITLLELGQLDLSKKKLSESKIDKFENKYINEFFIPEAQTWVKIQAKKLRYHKEISDKLIKALDFGMIPVTLQDTEHWLQQNHEDSKFALYLTFLDSSTNLNDWIRAEEPELASYTAIQALQASEEWHQKMAEQGANKIYQEGDSYIVYGPIWKNPEFNGWTIKQIKSSNDLDVEGHLMNHCVGSYAKEVQQDNSQIYSLRDSSNQPHVTIETKNDQVIQIQGNSNSEPKEKYKLMIKEWMQDLQEKGKKIISKLDNADTNLNEMSESDDILEYIDHNYSGGDYGIKPQLLHTEIKRIYENSLDYLEQMKARYNFAFQKYRTQKLPLLGQKIAKIALEHDLEWLEYLRNGEIKVTSQGVSWMEKNNRTPEEIKNQFIKHSAVFKLENIFNNNYEEVYNHLDYDHMKNEPLEENYHNIEDWKKAREEYDNLISEEANYYFNKDLPYILDNAIKNGFQSHQNLINKIKSFPELKEINDYA